MEFPNDWNGLKKVRVVKEGVSCLYHGTDHSEIAFLGEGKLTSMKISPRNVFMLREGGLSDQEVVAALDERTKTVIRMHAVRGETDADIVDKLDRQCGTSTLNASQVRLVIDQAPREE